jgi:hypothetical protein
LECKGGEALVIRVVAAERAGPGDPLSGGAGRVRRRRGGLGPVVAGGWAQRDSTDVGCGE